MLHFTSSLAVILLYTDLVIWQRDSDKTLSIPTKQVHVTLLDTRALS